MMSTDMNYTNYTNHEFSQACDVTNDLFDPENDRIQILIRIIVFKKISLNHNDPKKTL